MIIGNKHHYLGNAQEVLAAGQLKINGKGHIKRIDNLFGHYRPTVSEAMGYQSRRFSVFEPYYPLWIDIYMKENDIIELRSSLRFRKPSELQRRETGNVPFKIIEN